MAVADKIKSLLARANKDRAGLAAHLGISSQGLNNKLYRNAFSAEDLIRIAEYLDCSLAFFLKDGDRVSLTPGDLPEK